MSEIDEMLNAVAEESTSAGPGMGDSERYIVIGRDRYITVPDELKKIAVQYDDGVETVTVECPKTWDGWDLSSEGNTISVIYKRSDNVVGKDECKISTVHPATESVFYFEWNIKQHATYAAGNLTVLFCISGKIDGSEQPKEWRTELNDEDFYISEGLHGNDNIVNSHPDIISSLLTRMETIENHQPFIQMVKNADGSHTVTTTDLKGTYSFTVKNGVTFTPALADDGTLSWSNDGNLENPASVTIKGPQGEKGETGDKGDTGAGDPGKDGVDGENGVTFTPSVDINGNLTWTSSKEGVEAPAGSNIMGTRGTTFIPALADDGTLSWSSSSTEYPVPDPVNIKGQKGDTGDKGEAGNDGATFVPAVTEDGVISWSNTAGEENPKDVDFKSIEVVSAKHVNGLNFQQSDTGILTPWMRDEDFGEYAMSYYIRRSDGPLEYCRYYDGTDTPKVEQDWLNMDLPIERADGRATILMDCTLKPTDGVNIPVRFELQVSNKHTNVTYRPIEEIIGFINEDAVKPIDRYYHAQTYHCKLKYDGGKLYFGYFYCLETMTYYDLDIPVLDADGYAITPDVNFTKTTRAYIDNATIDRIYEHIDLEGPGYRFPLSAPVITVVEDNLVIADPSGYAEEFDIYANGELVATVTAGDTIVDSGAGSDSGTEDDNMSGGGSFTPDLAG